MKRLFHLIAAAALLSACGTNAGYTISGTADGAQDGDSVFLMKANGRQAVRIAATAVKNGTFSFSGKADSTELCYVVHYDIDDNQNGVDLLLENGNIKVNISTDSPSVTGTPNNDAYQQIRDRIAGIQADEVKVYDQLTDTTLTAAQRSELEKKAENLDNSLEQAVIDGCRSNITNAAGIYLLKQGYYYMDDAELSSIVSLVPDRFLSDPDVQRIKEYAEKRQATAVGQHFADLELQDPDGKSVKLSDYVGKSKLLLVDFWASWCGPCRQEMPNLVKAYQQYKDKGFQIVGVSLDRNADDWKQGIQDLGITWPQMSDLKYWDSVAADIYAVNSIPHTVLIDQSGTIVARGLRGDALLDRLKELDK